MEIKASSKYDWETFKSFYVFSLSKKHRWPSIVLVVVFLLLLAMYVFEAVNGTFSADLLPSMAMFITLYIAMGFVRFVLPKIQYNKNKLIHGIENIITFGEQKFEINQNGDNATGTASISYDAIQKIYETKEYIYIYISLQQAHIVDKATITGGSLNDLRALLSNAVGMSKYKLKCKV